MLAAKCRLLLHIEKLFSFCFGSDLLLVFVILL